MLRKLTLLKSYNDLAVGSGGEGWKPDNLEGRAEDARKCCCLAGGGGIIKASSGSNV